MGNAKNKYMLNSIWFYVTIFSVFLALLMSLGQFLIRRREAKNYILAGLLTSLAFAQLHIAFVGHNLIPEYPHLFRISIPFAFWIGPFFYFYFKLQLDRKNSPIRVFFHVLPGFLSIFVLTPFYLQSAPEKVEAFYKLAVDKQAGFYEIILLAGILSALIYIVLTVYRFRFFKNLSSWRNESVFRLTGFIVIFSLLACLLIAFTLISRNLIHVKSGSFIVAIIIIGIHLTSYRFPEFFGELSFIYEKTKYQKTLLEDIDVEQKLKDLERLFSEHRLHQKENLSLAELAGHLNLTSHQLSQLTNEHLDLNFSSLINERRIKEAQELLVHEEQRTILSIAFQVGFNSKSVFNTAFAKHSGQTPSQYRKKNSS